MGKAISFLSLFIMIITLTSCARSLLDNKDERCPFKDRGGCQSMEMVNKMVTEKRFTPDGQFVQQADGPFLRAWK